MVGAALKRVAAVVGGALLVAGSVSAQPRPPDAGDAGGQTPIRGQLQALEQALAAAVSRSTRAVEGQLPPGVPGLVLFAGPIQVRGFRLEDYGVFFDVEYPVLRGSILWSMQRLDPFELSMDITLQILRRHFPLPDGPADRGGAGSAPLGRIGARMSGRATDPRYAPGADSGTAPVGANGVVVDPQRVYRGALRVSLTDALLLGGPALGALLPEDALLTVAARDVTGVGGRDGQLRVRARDLVAFGKGRVSFDEVRERVEVSGF